MPWVRRTYEHQHSSVVVIPRPLYDDIGGFDEGFRGWGLEDTAFAIAVETLTGESLPHLARRRLAPRPSCCAREAWLHAARPQRRAGEPLPGRRRPR